MELIMLTLSFFFLTGVLYHIVGINGAFTVALVVSALVYCIWCAYKYSSHMNKIQAVADRISDYISNSTSSLHSQYYIDVDDLCVIDESKCYSILKLTKHFISGIDTVSIANKINEKLESFVIEPNTIEVWDNSRFCYVTKTIGCYLNFTESPRVNTDERYESFNMQYHIALTGAVLLVVLLVYMVNLYL